MQVAKKYVVWKAKTGVCGCMLVCTMGCGLKAKGVNEFGRGEWNSLVRKNERAKAAMAKRQPYIQQTVAGVP